MLHFPGDIDGGIRLPRLCELFSDCRHVQSMYELSSHGGASWRFRRTGRRGQVEQSRGAGSLMEEGVFVKKVSFCFVFISRWRC